MSRYFEEIRKLDCFRHRRGGGIFRRNQRSDLDGCRRGDSGGPELK